MKMFNNPKGIILGNTLSYRKFDKKIDTTLQPPSFWLPHIQLLCHWLRLERSVATKVNAKII